jgi:hypothetical protein
MERGGLLAGAETQDLAGGVAPGLDRHLRQHGQRASSGGYLGHVADHEDFGVAFYLEGRLDDGPPVRAGGGERCGQWGGSYSRRPHHRGGLDAPAAVQAEAGLVHIGHPGI